MNGMDKTIKKTPRADGGTGRIRKAAARPARYGGNRRRRVSGRGAGDLAPPVSRPAREARRLPVVPLRGSPVGGADPQDPGGPARQAPAHRHLLGGQARIPAAEGDAGGLGKCETRSTKSEARNPKQAANSKKKARNRSSQEF